MLVPWRVYTMEKTRGQIPGESIISISLRRRVVELRFFWTFYEWVEENSRKCQSHNIQ